MAETRREGPQAIREGERPSDNAPGVSARERPGEAAQQQAERLVGLGQQGMQQATEASAAAARGVLQSGSALGDSAQEITAAWARYAEQVMRHTSEASQALFRARTLNELLEVQTKLLRDNMQAFLDQSIKIAETASRMATRPLEALNKEAGGEQNRR
jgi:hypothetical protein